MMLNDIEIMPNVNNWAVLVKNTLAGLGFYHVWLAQGVGNTKHFLSIFKQRSHDNYIQDWNTRLSDSSRALFYRNIPSFEYQQYLDCNISSKIQSIYN